TASVQVNTRVLGFAAVLGVLTGLIFGLAPAWFSARTDLLEPLRGSGGRTGASPAQQRVRRTLVAAQLAIALVLLTGTGLLTRSFMRAAGVDPGFEPEHLASAWIKLPITRYGSDAERDGFFDRLVARLRPLPGVRGVSLADATPPSGMSMSIAAKVLAGGNDPTEVTIVTASRDYLHTIGIRRVAGRDFNQTDGAGGALSVLLSARAAREFFPRQSALGQSIDATALAGHPARATVIGIVADMPEPGQDVTPKPRAYFAREQIGGGQSTVLIRYSGTLGALRSMLQREITAIDRLQPIATLDDVAATMAHAIAPRRLGVTIVGVFAFLALLLAALGLYGVTAFQVTERTREMGVRMALGATARAVRSLIVAQGLRVILAGCVAGIILSLLLSRVLEGMLYAVGTRDPVAFALAPATLIIVASIACYLPARRATRVDPVAALRAE
ncbi:MAG: FtsX-like permease family protein, partial [Gemmatimonadaceae bacterium]